MTWFPIGPDFIYTPRDTTMSPPRISRRNMYARQTQIWNIAVDPSDPNTLYTVDQDTNISPVVKGGAVGHCTDDGGKSWTSITDSLQANFTFTPTCFAVHPLNSNYVYMGTNTGAFYVSSNKGQQWGAPAIVTNGPISQIVVDPRNAISPATTIYVGTGNSLFVSTTGGASFGGSPVLAGTISSLAFSLFAGGADCYAGVFQQGIYYSTNPTSNASWAAATGNGLPAVGTYDHIWLQYCPLNPHHADRSHAAAGELCNAKNDSVAYCDTTRPEQHEYWLGLFILTERVRLKTTAEEGTQTPSLPRTPSQL